MQSVKVYFIIVCIFIFTASIYPSDSITISKIKILVQDSEYIWNKDSSIELVSGIESYISPHTVISYTSLKPGNLYSLKQLDEETARTQIRLTNSGLFYTASVQIVPPRKSPQERTIVITVKEGFYHRFPAAMHMECTEGKDLGQ